jgi:glycine/D-amino acid oxidase-like deaminating enzyme
MSYQFVVIGGGFFGCAVALHLRRRGFEHVALIEREPQLLARSSYRNQARVHNGCHYPRSYLTASRSRINMPRFCREYGPAVRKDFTMLYAIAAERSRVTPHQFERFMRDIGVPYETAGSGYASLFDPVRIAGVYIVEEYAFDARRLREYFAAQLTIAGVHVLLGSQVIQVIPKAGDAGLLLIVATQAGRRHVEAEGAFNCTYSCLNYVVKRGEKMTPLKHEMAEIALVDVPSVLAGLGVTVMDGPFFSCMPFPAEDCHSLTHVRYTPQGFSVDRDGRYDPTRDLDRRGAGSRVHYMIADASRLMPCVRSVRWRRSLFEVKTVLANNEADDGRPVLLRREPSHPRLFSVLGAKIDNVYDILKRIDRLLDSSADDTIVLEEEAICPRATQSVRYS